jgi:hypothetical protein
MENTELARQSHFLGLQTDAISRDIHHLNRKGTEATIENVRAAKSTSNTTRMNVLVIWVCLAQPQESSKYFLLDP